MERYSQNREQDYILEYFEGRTAKFIDIGAFNAFQFSNTRALYEQGWAGILVEPAEKQYNGIKEVYKDEPRIEVLKLAVGTSNNDLEMFVCEDAVSTSVADWKDKWQDAGVVFQQETVKQIHVKDFMDKYFSDEVKFISLDTEKTNMEIFRQIPDYVWLKLECFCIEHDGCQLEIYQRLQPFGFRVIYTNAENAMLVK